MRALFAAAASAVLLASAGVAAAQAPVTVDVGPELAKKADRIGAQDVDYLRTELAEEISQALAKSGAQRADLVLEAASPNRPTFEQMRRLPSLSFSSRGIGGASVTGTVTLADGSVKPVSYRWYETDLYRTVGYSTWTDAERAFRLLGGKIARGEVPNKGPHHEGGRDQGLFGARY